MTETLTISIEIVAELQRYHCDPDNDDPGLSLKEIAMKDIGKHGLHNYLVEWSLLDPSAWENEPNTNVAVFLDFVPVKDTK